MGPLGMALTHFFIRTHRAVVSLRTSEAARPAPPRNHVTTCCNVMYVILCYIVIQREPWYIM